MEKGDEKSQILFKMMAPMLPFYMFKLSGKLDVELEPVDLKILLEMPQTEIANVNIHNLLTGMSPWGTIDDMELIHNDDEEGEKPPIWSSFEDHKEFGTPEQAA